MTATPQTTKLGPDEAHIRDLVRRLAEIESPDAPVLSVYLDMRAEALQADATGAPGVGDPTRTPGLMVLRDRLREIAHTLPAHGSHAESLNADIDRIGDYVTTEEVRSAQGVAIFACSALGVWETLTAGVPFETHVSAGPTADLFQLARLLDDYESAVVALFDTNTARLFVMRRGHLAPGGSLDEPASEHKRHKQGGQSQARYQRHVDEQDERFAKELADRIERLVQREAAKHVVLIGEERAVSVLQSVLSKQVLALVDDVERLQVIATREEVEADVLPVLERAEADASADVADRVIEGVRAGQLGVAGLEATMKALEIGQVDELVIDDAAEIDEELRAELVRQAALTSARVEVVSGHAGLNRFGGVGATLRYRV